MTGFLITIFFILIRYKIIINNDNNAVRDPLKRTPVAIITPEAEYKILYVLLM